MLTTTIEVLECTSGIGKTSGKPYNIVLARYNGKVGRYFSDTAMEITGKPVEVELVIGTDKNLNFTVGFKAVKLAK